MEELTYWQQEKFGSNNTDPIILKLCSFTNVYNNLL